MPRAQMPRRRPDLAARMRAEVEQLLHKVLLLFDSALPLVRSRAHVMHAEGSLLHLCIKCGSTNSGSECS